MEKVSVRFGLRTGSFVFPNAAVFVGKINAAQFTDLARAVSQLKTLLRLAGREDWADRLVFEKRD